MPARTGPVACPVCTLEVHDVAVLARHLVEEAERSEGGHVMWLNRHVTKHRVSPAELRVLLEDQRAGRRPSGDRVAR